MKHVLLGLVAIGLFLTAGGRPEVRGQGKEKDAPKKAKAPPGKLDKCEVSVFSLKHAQAAGVAKVIQDLFPDKDGFTLRVASVPTLNVVVVRGSRLELDMVEAVIRKLEDIAGKKGGKAGPAAADRAKVFSERASSSGAGTDPQSPHIPAENIRLGKHGIPTDR